MIDKLYLNYLTGGVEDLDILMTYRLTEDRKVEVVHCIYGEEAESLLKILNPEVLLDDLICANHYIEYREFRGMYPKIELFVYSGRNPHGEPFNKFGKFEALHLYRKLTGAPDNIRDMYPKTMLITHNHYADTDSLYPKALLNRIYGACSETFAEEQCKIFEEMCIKPFFDRNLYHSVPKIERVIYNAPATIVFWKDDTKTVVKAQGDDEFDPEKGLAMAICKKALGNDRDYYEVFLKHVGRYEKQQRKEQEMLEKLGICADEGYLDRLADGMKRFAEAAKQVAPHMPGDKHDS